MMLKMSWQDIVLSIGNVVFSVALLPSVFGKSKPAFSTSLMTGTTLLVFAVVYASLDLWVAMSVTIIGASLWLLLAFQKLRQSKPKKENI